MENLTGGTPPVRPLPCVVPCKLYFTADDTDLERFYQVIYRFISNPGLVQALVSDPEYKNLIALLGTGA